MNSGGQPDAVEELLGRLERPIAPSPAFAAALRHRLLTELNGERAPRSEEAPMQHPGLTVAPNGRAPAIPRLRPARRAPERRWWPALEVVAAAVLVLAIVGGTIVGNGGWAALFGHWQDDPNPGGEAAMFLGNAARTGDYPGPGPTGEPGLRWRRPLGAGGEGGGPTSSPIVADGVIYVSGFSWDADATLSTHALSAVDAATGAVRWRTEVAGLDDGGSPAVAGGLVFVTTSSIEGDWMWGPGTPIVEPTDAGALVAFDAATGAERWRYGADRFGYLSPAVANGLVYVGSASGRLHAVETTSGEVRWSVRLPSGGGILSPSSPAVAGDSVYIATSEGTLHALDAATGGERWRAPLGGNYPTTPVVAGDVVYVGAGTVPGPDAPLVEANSFEPGSEVTDDTGRLLALDAASGDTRWSYSLDRELRPAPAVADGVVYVAGLGTDGDEVRALDAADGRERWSFATGGPIDAPPAVADGVVYVANYGASLHALDAATGAPNWRIETGGGIIGVPFVAGGAVFVGSGDGHLYAIGGTTAGAGTPAATPAPTGDVSGLPPCMIAPRPELVVAVDATPRTGLGREFEPPLTGTPVASVVPVNEAQEYGQPAAIRPEELPTGDPAAAEVVAGITDTLEHLLACSRPGRERQVAAFFSDDYFRRPAVAAHLRYNGYPFFGLGFPEGGLFPLADVRLLPDGRVAVYVEYREDYGSFLVFVEEDGGWRIDASLEVTNNPDARG